MRPNILAVWLLLCATASAAWYEPAWTNYRFAESNLYATNLWAVYTNRVTSGAGYTNTFTYPALIASWSNVAGMVETQMLLQAADSRSFDVFRAIEERNRCITWCGPTSPVNAVFSYYREDYSNLVAAKAWIAENAHRFADTTLADEDGIYSNWFGAKIGTDYIHFSIPALTQTSLCAMTSARTNFFDDTSWRQGYSPTSDWHVARAMLTNMTWVIETGTIVTIGFRRHVVDTNLVWSIAATNTGDIYSEYPNPTNTAFDSDNGLLAITNERTFYTRKSISCNNDFGPALWFSVDRGAAGETAVDFEPGAATNVPACDTNGAPTGGVMPADWIYTYYVEFGIVDAYEYGAQPYVMVSTNRPVINVDFYGYFPDTSPVSTGDCFSAAAWDDDRPYYAHFGSTNRADEWSDIEDFPNDLDICEKPCISGSSYTSGMARFAWLPESIHWPFERAWIAIADNYNTNCVEKGNDIWPLDAQPMRTQLGDEIDQFYYDTYGMLPCDWGDNFLQEATQLQTYGDETAIMTNRPIFLNVIKYDWEYK